MAGRRRKRTRLTVPTEPLDARETLLVEELVAWIQAALPSQSYGAMPARLQEYVGKKSLPELRRVTRPFGTEVEDRTACIKRREQNQRAFRERAIRKQREATALNTVTAELSAHNELLTAYIDSLEELREYVATHDAAAALFGVGAVASSLYSTLNANHAKAPK